MSSRGATMAGSSRHGMSRRNWPSNSRALSWAVVWKYAIMDGRDMIERVLVNPPADMSGADVALVIGG